MRTFAVAMAKVALRGAVGWLEQANEHTRESFERLEATAAHATSFDENAYRAKVEAELHARDNIDWVVVADLFGLSESSLPPARMFAVSQP